MSVVETIKSVVGGDDSPDETHYECTNCGNEFSSYKTPERVSCPDCVSQDVEPTDA